MKIKEDNLPLLIKESFKTTHDWSDTFDVLYTRMHKEKEPYASIESNFLPIFTLELIKLRTPIKDFDTTMKHMLSGLGEKDVRNLFYRFYDTSTELSFVDYLKSGRYQNSHSCWDNMRYIFLDYEYKNKQHWSLTPENIPYLNSMFNSVDKDNVLGVYEGLSRFVYQFEVKELIPLIEMTQNNPLYQIEKEGYNHKFESLLLRYVCDKSYDNSSEKNKEDFKLLQMHMLDFESLYTHDLIKYKTEANRHSPELKINLSIMNFLLSVGVDTCALIDRKYKESYEQADDKKKSNMESEISSSLHVMLKKDVDFDLNIDTSAPLNKNYVVLKYLENKVKHGGTMVVSESVKDYLKIQFELEKSKPSYEQLDIKTDAILPYLRYIELEAKIPEKTNAVKKRKI